MKSLLIVLSMFLVSSAFGATTPTKSDANKKMEFDDLLVQGKYQMTEEAVTTVEQDKVLDSLLSVRKNFRDRIDRSSGQF